MESLNDTLSGGGIGDDDDDIIGIGGGNESVMAAATTESAFFIDPPDDPALAPCISFVLKSDIKVGKKERRNYIYLEKEDDRDRINKQREQQKYVPCRQGVHKLS